MKIDDRFVLREIADTWVVVPTGQQTVDFNRLLRLSDSAAFLWKQLASGIEKDELLEVFIQEYDVEAGQAEKDLEDFLEQLQEIGIKL